MSIHDWSKRQKEDARRLFDLAYSREAAAIKQDALRMLQGPDDQQVIWRVHDYLSKKRREVDRKYDYRYSQLLWVFAVLLGEGWLSIEELKALGDEKAEAIGMAAGASTSG